MSPSASLILNQSIRCRIDNVLVQYHIFDPQAPVMITFPPGSAALTPQALQHNDSAWAFEFFAKRGMNIIAFNHIGDSNLFESIHFSQFIASLGKQLVCFPSRIGYGVSRGGFGISLYAHKLNLTRALLLMPISTYNLNLAPWDPKVQAANKHSPAPRADASECSTPLTIIYDPLSFPDKRHALRYPASTRFLKLPGVGHRISRSLQQLGLLGELVLEYRSGAINEQDYYQKIRARRQLSYFYKGLSSNPTGKLTLKRKVVIYHHKWRFKLAHIEQEPAKFLGRLSESINKRIARLIGDSAIMLPQRIFAMGVMFVCC